MHWPFPGTVETMSTPGAATPTNSPAWENAARSLLRSEEATARTPGKAAGYVSFILPSMPSLPAEATTTMSRASALATALPSAESSVRGLVVSWEMLMTLAPLAIAWSIAVAIVVSLPLLFSSFCRIGMMVASGASPTNPVPLRGRAAMMPATLVPWPTSSVVPSLLPP